jgi:hypothetical protein
MKLAINVHTFTLEEVCGEVQKLPAVGYHTRMAVTWRLIYHADKIARRPAMIGILAVPLARWILHKVHASKSDEIWKSVLLGAAAAVIIYLGSFAACWLRRNDLDDPPRAIPHRKRKKMAAVLGPYGHGNYPVVTIDVCQSASHGIEFAKSIQKALTESGWRVHSINEVQCKPLETGVCISGDYPQAIHPDWPAMNDVLKTAFEAAGVTVRTAEQGRGWMYINIGPREGKASRR